MLHAETRWKVDHALWYQKYVKIGEDDLKDAASLSYGDSLRQIPKKTRLQLINSQIDDEDPSDAKN